MDLLKSKRSLIYFSQAQAPMSLAPSKTRVRFAPSPTGFFHIGSARTALFNWLYARHTGGTFILRIEDTDEARNTPEALRVLLEGMRWLGLDWDEGPETGGPCGPYFQSQRGQIYKDYLALLQKTGRVYEKEGALYFRVSGQTQHIPDLIRGDVYREEEKDFIIIRSNGTPVFHFVNVVDDIAMGITHIIRGEDHLSNTSKHVELFHAFGRTPPLFAHIPLILKTEGSGKMSKRDQGSLIGDYQKRHFSPQALRNYLCLLGWSPKDDKEILSLDEMIAAFKLEDVNKNNARFDEKKLSHINSLYLRQTPPALFKQEAKAVLLQAGLISKDTDLGYAEAVAELCQEKLKALDELPGFSYFFFKEDYPIDPQAEAKLSQKQDVNGRLRESLECFKALDTYDASSLEQGLKSLAEAHTLPISQYMTSLRLALSGKDVGPAFYPLLCLLGKEKVIQRLEAFLAQ